MNPELPQVNRTPEVQPQNIGGGEYNVENTSLNPEVGRESEKSLGARVEQYNNIPVALPLIILQQFLYLNLKTTIKVRISQG